MSGRGEDPHTPYMARYVCCLMSPPHQISPVLYEKSDEILEYDLLVIREYVHC